MNRTDVTYGQLDNVLRSLGFSYRVLKKDPPIEVAGQLAAGPLEDLLIKRGSDVIDRVEAEARQNAKFRDLLGSMYTSGMPGEIRERVDRLASEKW